MKKKIVLLGLLCIVACINVFGQDAKTIQERAFGKIRMNMVEDACKKYGYNNEETIKKLNAIKVNEFHNALANDTAQNVKNRWLWNALGNVPSINGTDPTKDKGAVEKYLNQIQTACREHENIDTIDGEKYRNQIKMLFEECSLYRKCETSNDFSEYSKKYRNGIFKNCIPEEKPQEENTTVEHEPAGAEEPASEEVSHSDDSEVFGPSNSGRPKGGGDNPPLNLKDILFMVILGVVIGGIIVVGGVTGLRYIKNRKKQNPKHKRPTTVASTVPIAPKPAPIGHSIPSPEEIADPAPHITSPNDNTWILVGASVKGNGHIQNNMPCQDNHKFESIGDGWGIAVVSDGAGSASHSELGSKVVVERAIFHFKKLIEEQGWVKSNTLPTDMGWWQKSYEVLKTIRNEVAMVAKKYDFEVKSLSATCLVVIYSPLGLLAVHVGDGRMGYKSVTGEWKAMMTPHKGEEANQTIFLVSDFWSIPNFALSGVLVPESVVVREPVKAFTLMSDGCENTSWQCVTLNQETGKYYDQNKPFERFFNPLEETLISFQANNVPNEEQQAKWNRFIESGTDGFVREQDDKTMIYGYCCSQQEIDDYIEKSKVPAPSN